MAKNPHEVISTEAKRRGLSCSRGTSVVEVVRGPAAELGLRTAKLCRDPKSPTGTTAVVNYHGQIAFLPFGKRADWRAWAVPRFLAHPAARARAEWKRGA